MHAVLLVLHPFFGIQEETGHQLRESTVKKSSQVDSAVIEDLELGNSQHLPDHQLQNNPQPESPGYIPSALAQSIEENRRKEENEVFRKFSKIAGIQQLRIGREIFENMNPRSQATHVTQAKQIFDEVMRRLCPNAPEQLWKAIVDKEVRDRDADESKQKLMQSIADAYSDANHPANRLQFLSILANSMSFSECQQHIPTLSRSSYNRARKHAKEFGAGTAALKDRDTYLRYSPVAVEHFITYVLSCNVVSDLPFGEATMKLSTGECVTVPNVIRDAIPERIVSEYRKFVQEQIEMKDLPENFPQLQRSSLLRILEVCKASKRKALQG